MKVAIAVGQFETSIAEPDRLDATDKHRFPTEHLADVMANVLQSMEPPRPFVLLAMVIESLAQTGKFTMSSEENRFVEAAENLASEYFNSAPVETKRARVA